VDKYGPLVHSSLFHTVGLGLENLESKKMAARRNEFSDLIYAFFSLLCAN